jgi:hypothetical protein
VVALALGVAGPLLLLGLRAAAGRGVAQTSDVTDR